MGRGFLLVSLTVLVAGFESTAANRGLMDRSESPFTRQRPVGMDAGCWTKGFWADRFGRVREISSCQAPVKIALAVRAPTSETILQIQSELWTPRLWGIAETLRAEAAGFSIIETDRGPALSVGPWRGGNVGARYEYARRLPFPSGKVRGWYRTIDLLPKQAALTVEFYRGATRLGVQSFPLATATNWTFFEVPVTRPLPGSESVTVAFGLSDKTEGKVLFAELSVSPELNRPEFPEQPAPLSRPKPPRGFAPSKYVRLEQREGTWWLVTPEGKAFFSLGVNPRPFRPATVEEPREVYGMLSQLGFNSLAGGHAVERWAAFNEKLIASGNPPLFQFRLIQTNTDDPPYETVRDAKGLNPGEQAAEARQRGGFNHAFPDPYDPRWETWLREQVRKVAKVLKGKPYFAAWFADNERQHRELHRYVYSRYCAREFRRFLENRHGSIENLNRAWGTDYASFDDLLERKPDPVMRVGGMYADFHDFRREIIRRFNQTYLRVIREEDPGRLVFSNRFMIHEGRDLIENLDLYRDFDGIAVNIYPSNLRPGLAPDERETLELIHARTGKPILISEWSVPALDSGLYNNPAHLDWSYPRTVDSQQQRAQQAALVLTEFYNLPYVVGAHWFTWTDFDSPVRQANRGLFTADGEPWTKLQEALRSVMLRIAQQQGDEKP